MRLGTSVALEVVVVVVAAAMTRTGGGVTIDTAENFAPTFVGRWPLGGGLGEGDDAFGECPLRLPTERRGGAGQVGGLHGPARPER